MIVRVAELGARPFGLTPARRYAPAGAQIMGEILGEATFADYAEVVLDWSNKMRLQPEDAVKPVLLVAVVRRFPDLPPPDNMLTVSVRLDVEDLFGNDEMTAEAIHAIIHEMRLYLESKTQERMASR